MIRPADRDTSKLPKWVQDRLHYAEATATTSATYWEQRVAEATSGKGPYTFIMAPDERGLMPCEIRVRLVGDEIEVMSQYGGALIIHPQVTNVIRVGVERR